MISNLFGGLIEKTSYDQLPEDVIETAKLRLLDYFAVLAAGFEIQSYRPIAALAVRNGEASIFYDGRKTSLRDAALVNSFMAHSTWYEDGSRSTGGHPSSALLPALLAIAESRRKTGKDVILSTVIGYEIFNRIGQTMYPSSVRRGFQPTAILAPISAAAACAKVLNLSAKQIANAMNIAAPLGAGLKSAFKVGEVQPLQVARGCEAGLTAAILAEQNLSGYDGNIDSFLYAYGINENSAVSADGWGIDYKIRKTYVKLHGGCRGNHAPIDAVRKIVLENHLKHEDIETIKITIDTVTAANEIHDPKNKEEAQFNIPFSIAVWLVKGNATIYQFSDENLHDPVIIACMGKVNIEIDPELDKLLPDKRGAKAEIVLRNGAVYRSFVDTPLGEPENPLTKREIVEKFAALAEKSLKKNTKTVIDCVFHLEQLKDISEFVQLFKAE